MGQILLAKRMGKTRIIAETGAGQHGVATATVCARFGLPCVVYMGATDVERQAPNVFRMKLLGAEVRSGDLRRRHAEGRDERGAARLGDQCRRHLLLHRHRRRPAPLSGHGARLPVGHRQGDARADAGAEGRLPDTLVACIGGGSNAIGLFHPFLDDPSCASSASRPAATASTPDQHAPR
jgi:tryptophan synthase beta chain